MTDVAVASYPLLCYHAKHGAHCFKWDAVFLLTLGSFLLRVEFFYLQLIISAFLFTILVSVLTVLVFCLQLEFFCLQWESASNKGLKGL